MVAKSIREAKSTVRGCDEEMTETGEPSPSGVSVAPVIVTVRESTAHSGASDARIASEPVATVCCRTCCVDDLPQLSLITENETPAIVISADKYLRLNTYSLSPIVYTHE